MRVALVSTDPDVMREVDTDIPPLLAALGRVGVDSAMADWHDDEVDWDAFDLVVIKSPWDYSERLEEFRDWLAKVGDSARLLNCPHLIRWNLDKRYLADLAEAGVNVVPTTFADSAAEVSAALDLLDSKRVVIKPTVSAGSRNTGLFEVGDPNAHELAAQILGLGKTVMIQPAIEQVSISGEHALVLFDGGFSHAVNKGPLLAPGGGLLGGQYQESIRPIDPAPGEVNLARQANQAASAIVAATGCDCADPTPLYGRFDIVSIDDGFAILEAELFEPSYFVGASEGAAGRFARATAARLSLRRMG